MASCWAEITKEGTCPARGYHVFGGLTLAPIEAPPGIIYHLTNSEDFNSICIIRPMLLPPSSPENCSTEFPAAEDRTNSNGVMSGSMGECGVCFYNVLTIRARH